MSRRCLIFVLNPDFSLYLLFFFFNDTATTEIYTLSLHDALPISVSGLQSPRPRPLDPVRAPLRSPPSRHRDRKSTRLNSSHGYISYAVFCLKKKKTTVSNRRMHELNRA